MLADAKCSRYGDSQLVAHVDAAAAQQCILAAADATAGPLFIKDLAFQAYHYLGDDLLQQLAHTLLLRHPLRVMASLLRLKPDFSEEELGFQALAALFDRITSLKGKPPAILEGEEFRARPRRILQHYCRSHGLIFSESMLSWSSGALRPWRPHERESQQKWHATLERSRTILPPTDAWPRLQLSCRQEAMLERALAIYSRLAGQARPILHLSALQQR